MTAFSQFPGTRPGLAFLLTTCLCALTGMAEAQGTAWRDLEGPSDSRVTELGSFGGSLWAGTLGGNLYRGATGKDDWRFVPRHLDTNQFLQSPTGATGMAQLGGSFYVSFAYHASGYPEACGGCADPSEIGGLYRIPPDGSDPVAFPMRGINALYADADSLYASTPNRIFKSRDGSTWTPLPLSPAEYYQAVNSCHVNFCLTR